jgi:hypothetical protein
LKKSFKKEVTDHPLNMPPNSQIPYIHCCSDPL